MPRTRARGLPARAPRAREGRTRSCTMGGGREGRGACRWWCGCSAGPEAPGGARGGAPGSTPSTRGRSPRRSVATRIVATRIVAARSHISLRRLQPTRGRSLRRGSDEAEGIVDRSTACAIRGAGSAPRAQRRSLTPPPTPAPPRRRPAPLTQATFRPPEAAPSRPPGAGAAGAPLRVLAAPSAHRVQGPVARRALGAASTRTLCGGSRGRGRGGRGCPPDPPLAPPRAPRGFTAPGTPSCMQRPAPAPGTARAAHPTAGGVGGSRWGGGGGRAGGGRAGGQNVCCLLRPLPRAKYPELSAEEEAVSVPLQVAPRCPQPARWRAAGAAITSARVAGAHALSSRRRSRPLESQASRGHRGSSVSHALPWAVERGLGGGRQRAAAGGRDRRVPGHIGSPLPIDSGPTPSPEPLAHLPSIYATGNPFRPPSLPPALSLPRRRGSEPANKVMRIPFIRNTEPQTIL